MTKHTDLIERLTDEAYEWSRYVTEDRAPSTLSDYLEPHIKAVANALEAQAREIEGLRKDAALVAARERERIVALGATVECPRSVDDDYLWERAIDAYAAAIRALNTEGEGNDPITG